MKVNQTKTNNFNHAKEKAKRKKEVKLTKTMSKSENNKSTKFFKEKDRYK